MDRGLATIGVAVPVHNEEQLLPGCLHSIRLAVERAPLPVRVVVALDRCHDRSDAVVETARAAGLDVRSVRSGQPGVGAARASAVRSLLTEVDSTRCWLATTDADSVVPPDWFVRQLAHAQQGADMVVGTVRIEDWSEHSPQLRDRYLAGYHARPGHRHMHGANLSFRADSYLRAGGFHHRDFDEDVDLISRFDRLGVPLIWAADVEVVTSARRIGRAPAGFADFLVDLEETP